MARWYKGKNRKKEIGRKRWRQLKRAAAKREGTHGFDPLLALPEWGSYESYTNWAAENPERNEMYFNFQNEDEYNSFIGDSSNENNFFSGLSNLWNKWTGNGMTDADMQANQANRDNMKFEQDLALQTWKQTQSYEARVADMQRAGMNPALMMSGSAGSAPAQAASPTSAAPNVTSDSMPNILSGFIGMMMQAKELSNRTKLNNAEVENVNADTANKSAITRKTNLESDILEIDRAYSNVRNQIYTAKGLSEIQNNIKDLEVKDGIIKIQGTEIALNDKELLVKDANILVMQADASLKNIEAEKARSLLPYAVEYFKADIALKESTVNLNDSNAVKAHADALISFADAAIKNGLIKGDYIEKFLSKMDADTFASIGSGIHSVAEAGTAGSKIAANTAIARNQNAQASYTEEEQEYLAADKIIGYLATGISAICDITGAYNDTLRTESEIENGKTDRRNSTARTVTGLLPLLLRAVK